MLFEIEFDKQLKSDFEISNTSTSSTEKAQKKEKKDFYSILGLTSDATSEEIKKSFRKLAIKYHPDKHKDDKLSEENFKLISEAYDILGNPLKKERYDRWGISRDIGCIFPGRIGNDRFTIITDYTDDGGWFIESIIWENKNIEQHILERYNSIVELKFYHIPKIGTFQCQL